MFINALSWKKFNSSKKKSVDSSSKGKAGLAFRAPLDNIHPIVDNNKNIQNALCHGSKSTSLAETKKNLDIVRSGNLNTETKKNANLCSKKSGLPVTTVTLQSSKVSISNSNSVNNNSLEEPVKTQKQNDNDEIVKKLQQSNGNRFESLAAKPGPKKTVIQVRLGQVPGVPNLQINKTSFTPVIISWG